MATRRTLQPNVNTMPLPHLLQTGISNHYKTFCIWHHEQSRNAARKTNPTYITATPSSDS
jgi:hypothetical protein